MREPRVGRVAAREDRIGRIDFGWRLRRAGAGAGRRRGGGRGWTRRGRGPSANPYASLAAFCRVAATLTPTSDSDIKAEVWLPASNWNGKYQAVGSGGWAGAISYPAMAAAVTAGYATASTDTGHTGGTADFALGHPEKLVDFGYRAIHETTVVRQAGRSTRSTAPRRRFRSSTAARPADVRRSPKRSATRRLQRDRRRRVGVGRHADARAARAVSQQINASADGVIPPSKLPMIHTAVLEACDALDAVKDGVIENPLQCHFDYARLACKGADGPDCLTPGQVNAAKVLTSPLADVQDRQGHRSASSDGPAPSSDGRRWAARNPSASPCPGWRTSCSRIRAGIGARSRSRRESKTAAKADGGALFSGDPNLKPFFDRTAASC